MKKRAKIVYVARNPKDLAVSYYKFHQWQPMLPDYDSWDEYFDDFMAGKCKFAMLIWDNLKFLIFFWRSYDNI